MWSFPVITTWHISAYKLATMLLEINRKKLFFLAKIIEKIEFRFYTMTSKGFLWNNYYYYIHLTAFYPGQPG